MDLGLTGRQAIITGAGKGIGRAIAEQLYREGCDVVLVGRTQSDLDSVAASLAGEGRGRIEARAVAFPDEGAVRALAEAYRDADIVVNNAGAIPGGYLKDVELDRWRKGWDGKLFGYAAVMQAFLPLMEARRRGVIINIIGAAGERPSADYIPGSAGNAAIMAMTRALGASSPASGVRVVGINPGPILTDRLKGLLELRAEQQLGDRGAWSKYLEPLPFGRAGTSEEVAAMVAMLASDLSGYISGTIITIDGGMTARGTSF